ncbi:MAG: head GIN domain-containing protein [Bacteroidales bacterium]
MKKKSSRIFLPFFMAMMLLFTGTHMTAQKTRNVSDFSKISIAISADVYLSQGDKESLCLEGDQDILEKIETVVSGNTLQIKYKSSFFMPRKKNITVHLTAKDIDELNIAGSAELKAKTKISAPEINFNISGSGKIEIDELETNNIEASISGSGDIILKGSKKLKNIDLSISGSGKYIAPNLQTENIHASISGSGKCEVYASKKLTASVSGSGKAYYNGNPVVNAKISGSGNVSKK